MKRPALVGKPVGIIICVKGLNDDHTDDISVSSLVH